MQNYVHDARLCNIAVDSVATHIATHSACVAGNYSIGVQAVVNGQSKFIALTVGFPGNAHDSRCWRHSQVPEVLDPLLLAQARFYYDGIYFPPCILGDAAYAGVPKLLMSYLDKETDTVDKHRFNLRLNRARMVVEIAFGMLKNKFRILLNRFPARKLGLVIKMVYACAIMHNWCIDDSERVTVQQLDNFVADFERRNANLIIGELADAQLQADAQPRVVNNNPTHDQIRERLTHFLAARAAQHGAEEPRLDEWVALRAAAGEPIMLQEVVGGGADGGAGAAPALAVAADAEDAGDAVEDAGEIWR